MDKYQEDDSSDVGVVYITNVAVPDDAGEWADGLRVILERFPVGYGRWIDTDPSWYPALIGLDRSIARDYPNYKVYRVRQRGDSIRYWTDVDGDPMVCQCVKDTITLKNNGFWTMKFEGVE